MAFAETTNGTCPTILTRVWTAVDDCGNAAAATQLVTVVDTAPPRFNEQVLPVDVAVEAVDRSGLLRDISDVFAREKLNVVGVQTQSARGLAWMTFTIEVSSSAALAHVLAQVAQIGGVLSARRK